MTVKKLLHAGSGCAMKPPAYAAYRETRLDADRSVLPDVIASIVAMPMIGPESYDAVYCSHCLEHLAHHEVGLALAEFWRLLKPGGILDLAVPDLQAVAGRIACDEPESLLYQSPIGPITPLDVFFGHRGSVARGHAVMQHRTGFTATSLYQALSRAGFERITVERAKLFELKALAYKPEDSDAGEEQSTAEMGVRGDGCLVGSQAPL